MATTTTSMGGGGAGGTTTSTGDGGAGATTTSPSLVDLVVNEVFLDPGDAAGNNEDDKLCNQAGSFCFIELYSATGIADLSQYTLHFFGREDGCNEHDIPLALQGTIPPGGYFVIVHPVQGASSCADLVPPGVPCLTASQADMPNGILPWTNSVVVERHDGAGAWTAVDEVGYHCSGCQAPGLCHVEGEPLQVQKDTLHSSSRCPNGSDTNNNAADFAAAAPRTPGAANDCPPP